MDLIFNYFWILLIVFLLAPSFQHRILEVQRIRIIRKIEKNRKSRVIVLIHRQEIFAFFGIPFTQFINIEDSEKILRAIRLTPPQTPIDMVIHTPGGLVLASEQIARALIKHPGKVSIFIPHYAMSGGTLLALAGDEIIMDENAVLGPLDPIIGEYPAISIFAAIEKKPAERVEDKTFIFGDIAKKAIRQVSDTIIDILKENGMEEIKAKKIANNLSSGKWTHDFPITFEEAQKMELPVKRGLPKEIYELMEHYPQPGGRRPSVQYIPVPYEPEPKRPRKPIKR